jgi:hypothetical protein
MISPPLNCNPSLFHDMLFLNPDKRDISQCPLEKQDRQGVLQGCNKRKGVGMDFTGKRKLRH